MVDLPDDQPREVRCGFASLDQLVALHRRDSAPILSDLVELKAEPRLERGLSAEVALLFCAGVITRALCARELLERGMASVCDMSARGASGARDGEGVLL